MQKWLKSVLFPLLQTYYCYVELYIEYYINIHDDLVRKED